MDVRVGSLSRRDAESSSLPVVVRDLTKRYGAVTAVDRINFSLHPATTVALLGGNGAGKTTTIAMLLGLVMPTSGEVRVFGADMSTDRGAVVAQPSLDRLTEMFEAMAELEALCAWFAAERMSPADRQKLEAIHEELRVLSHAGNPERFHEVNERFHNAIYAGSQNSYIAEMTLATRVRVQPFRRAQFRNLGRLAKSHAEHDRVVVAIMRGDKNGAAGAMRAHIELVRGEYELYAVSV